MQANPHVLTRRDLDLVAVGVKGQELLVCCGTNNGNLSWSTEFVAI